METALSIKESGVKGDIYALGVANFKSASLVLEDKTRPIIICADQDGENSIPYKTVERAVESLTEEGFKVSIIRPTAAQGRGDFNDVLKREEVEGVREYFKEYLDPVQFQSMSKEHQVIFSELKKSIMENKYFSEERKDKWVDFALRDPEGTLRSWNNILVNQEIQEERIQERQKEIDAYYAFMKKQDDLKNTRTGGNSFPNGEYYAVSYGQCRSGDDGEGERPSP